MITRPSILLTNDDGVDSNGLLSIATRLREWAEVTIAAPLEQESRMGRATPSGRSGRIFRLEVPFDGGALPVFGIDGTPAQAVQHAILEIMPAPPDLVVSGINYGENVGITCTVSGTIGAVLEAGSWGIPGVAFSLEMPGERMQGRPQHDFSAVTSLTSEFCRKFVGRPGGRPRLLKVDYPSCVTDVTPWVAASVSRVRKYDVVPAERSVLWDRGPLELQHESWRSKVHQFEEGSDAHVLFVNRWIAVTPLTPDPTAYEQMNETAAFIGGEAH